MREFKSLKPIGLPKGFDAEIYGEEPIVDVKESKRRIVVSYTFPGFYISDDARDVNGKKTPFKQVNIEAAGFLAESGKPLLPSFGRYLQIPPNCNYKVTVKKGKPVQFDDVLMLPAQEQLTDSPEKKPAFEYDKKTYAADALYPKEIVEITGPFDIDGYTSLLIHVRPFQYNPAKKQLIGYSNITVTIDVTPKGGDVSDQPLTAPEVHREAFGNLFLNPGRGIEDRLEMAPIVMPTPVFWLIGPEFLIIYHKTFKKAAEKLAKWKNMRGLTTEIVSIDTVGNSVAAIKKYIRTRRKKSMLRYVLLFGDVDMITPYDTSVEPWGAPQPPDFWGNNITDYYYSTEKDPTSSTNYLLPWLSIGRIPVRTAAQGMDVVDQIISYEKLPPTDSDYYDRMVFAGYFQDHEWWESPASADGRACRAYMKTMEEIRSHMITLGYDVERVYVSQYTNVKEYVDGTPVPADVVASIVDPATATNMLLDATTDGQLIVGHRDHGDIDGWSHPPFNTGHLGSVTGDMPTIFYSVNCLTGQFDLTAPTESFAEHILRMKGAAPSLIAATRVSHSWLNNDMIKALFDAMWGGVLPTFPGSTASYPVKRNRLGDILNYAKAYLPVAMSGSAEYIKDHYEIYHVVGDPTLELWKSEPLRIKIRALIRQGYLDISLSSCPKYSVITVWWKDKLIKKISPSSTHMKIALKGIVELPLPWRPIRPPIFVCFWAPGYRFCQVIPRMEIRPITAIPVKAKKVRP